MHGPQSNVNLPFPFEWPSPSKNQISLQAIINRNKWSSERVWIKGEQRFYAYLWPLFIQRRWVCWSKWCTHRLVVRYLTLDPWWTSLPCVSSLNLFMQLLTSSRFSLWVQKILLVQMFCKVCVHAWLVYSKALNAGLCRFNALIVRGRRKLGILVNKLLVTCIKLHALPITITSCWRGFGAQTSENKN